MTAAALAAAAAVSPRSPGMSRKGKVLVPAAATTISATHQKGSVG
jgi:hypothetical protein